MIEVARSRCALPHQASARLLKFCAHAKNNSRPSMISTFIVTMKSVLTSRSMAIDDSAVMIVSVMATNYRLRPAPGFLAAGQTLERRTDVLKRHVRNLFTKGVGNELDCTARTSARDHRRQPLRFPGIGVRRDLSADRRRSRLRGDDVRGLSRFVQR